MKNSKPKVSLLIPAYRQTKYLQKVLESIKMQSFKNYEIIITDDSPDYSVRDLVKKYNFENKLRYFKNQKTLGSPNNWNQAINLSKGEYIKFIHHDDWFLGKDSLCEFVEALDKNISASFAFSSSVAYGPKNKKQFIHAPNICQINQLKKNFRYLLLTNLIGAPSSTIYRKTKKIKFDPKLKWLVDVDFYISILQKNSDFVFIPHPLVGITNGAPHQITNECSYNREIELFEYLYIYNKVCNGQYLRLQYLKLIYNILQKYQVNSFQDIKTDGYNQTVITIVKLIIIMQKFKNMVKKVRLFISGKQVIPPCF